jgi:hypothetical protein
MKTISSRMKNAATKVDLPSRTVDAAENSPEIKIVLKKMVMIQDTLTALLGFFFCLGKSDFKMFLLHFAVHRFHAFYIKYSGSRRD